MKTKEEIPNYRAETCSSPLGETGDYDSWIELVCPSFNLQCYDPNVQIEEVQELADKLNASQFQQEWIPVEKRLPEITMRTSSDWVLTFDGSITRIDKAFYSTVTGWQAEHGEPMNVSHWMPLPTPPLPQPYNPKQP